MFADATFIEKVKQFISSQQTKVERNYADKWIDYLAEWREWFDNYLQENRIDNLPPSWSSSEPLPIATVVTEGDAGTGKTFSINTMMKTIPNGTVSSFARKGTDAFLDYAIPDTIPDGLNHIIQNNTICKMFKIKFSHATIRARLKDIKNDIELEKSYESVLHDARGLTDKHHAEDITRKHFQLVAKKLWPLVTECYNELLQDFFHKGVSVFRRDVMDEDHPMYTGDKLVPRLLVPYVNTLKAALAGKQSTMSKEDAEERVHAAESTLKQDTYRLNVSMGTTSSNINSLPAPVLFPVLLFEEDGMAPAFYGDIRKILTFLSLMIYLPPYIMTMVPVIVSSGSTTQSTAIGTAASALEMCSTPSHLADEDNVLPFKSEFFRRDKNNFQTSDALACRATCMTLERGLPVSPYTYTSMYVHEEHSTLVDDPGYIPEGTRLYRKHVDVSRYTDKMSSTGKANLTVTDIVFVADNIAPINGPPGSPIEIMEGLSSLTDNEASANRIRMWRDKQRLYANYTNPTKSDWEKKMNVLNFYSNDSGCNPVHEQLIAEVHHDLVKKRTTENAESHKHKRIDDESFMEVVECCDTGAVLPSDETFDENALNNVLYDRLVNDRKRNRVRRKRRGRDGQTHVIEDIEDKEERKEGLTFIVGRAVKMLGRKEHLAKRQHAEAIAEKLGDGISLARHYLDGSKVVDQFGRMTYDPFGDTVIEFARPNYSCSDFDKSVHETTNARILYMAFKRVRYLTKNAPVTNEKTTTHVVFRGISCTLVELLENTTFAQHTPCAFKCMVYGGVMEKFMEWWIYQLKPSLLLDMIDSRMIKDAYKNLYSTVPKQVCEILDEYERLVNETLEKQEPEEIATIAERRRRTVNQLTIQLERLAVAICGRVGKVFAKEVILEIYVDRSPLYPLLKYENKSVLLNSLRLNSVGDVKIVDSGRSDCNAIWRQDKEREYVENIQKGARYPPSLLRREEAMYNNKQPIKPATALWMGVETFHHELYMDSICTLLLGDSLLVTTQPYCSPEVNWSTIFTEPKNNMVVSSKPDTFGLILRRGMVEMGASKNNTVNSMFLMNGAELMNLPRPFRPQTCNVFSDVILKTRNLVLSSAQKPRSMPSQEVTYEELNRMNSDDLKIKRFEMAVIFGIMNPIYGTPASTVAYAQGSTHRGYVLLNFEKIGKSDQLVGITRNSDVTKLKVSAVSAATVDEENARAIEKREYYRKRIGCMSQYYFFRQ